MPEFAPWIDKKITDWSGERAAPDLNSEKPPKLTPSPAAREVFGPARRLVGEGPQQTAPTPAKRGPRPNYRLPE